MSQTVKTIVFIVVAGVSAITAYVTRPRPQAARLTVDINRPLFEKYDDPEEAARIRIVRIDEQLGQFIEFVLERDPETKLWRVPSEYNYPADQEDRIRDALTALVGLTPIDKVAEKTSDHELLGVVEPKSDLEVSQQGTGTLVIVEDRSDNVLAKLIIGKEGRSKKDSATGPQDEERLFFVRKPAEDVVYIAKLKPDVFSTDFKDWIHKNLLKIDSFDVEGLTFLNYSVPYDEERTPEGTRIRPRLESINHKMDVDLRWDNRQARWELKRFVTYADGRPIDTKLAETEELNSLKLDDIKRAVAQLELVGVRPLPEGLDTDLREGREFQNNREYLQSLMRRGFFPRADGNQIGLVSENGEMVVSTRDGVQYVLRFGGTAALSGESGQDSAELTRFLMVSARIDESQFTELPPESRGPASPGKPIGPELKPSSSEAKEKGGAEKQGEAETSPQPPAPLRQPPEKAPAKAPKKAPQETPKKEAAPATKREPAGTSGEADGKKTDDSKADKGKTDGEGKKPQAQGGETSSAESTDAQKQEQQRKLDELRSKYLKAKAKVNELNFRFGGWYYIISEESFGKIRLTRAQLVKESPKAKEKGDDVDAFRNLEKKGLETP